MKRTGGCQCGAVRYESSGEPRALYVCHCAECRKQSASAFGMSLVVQRSGFHVSKGTPDFWTRRADSGRQVRCAFCPICGSRLWHEREGISETVTIKAGSLDKPVDMTNAIHIWTLRKLPGVIIPEDALQYPEEPPDD
jgi:hypothetical protein